MLRLSTLSKSAAIVFAVSIVLALPQRSQAQGTAALLKLLDVQIPTKHVQGIPMIAKETLGLLIELVRDTEGVDLPILIDTEAFKLANPDAPDIHETRVTFPPFPSKMTVANYLRFVLSRVETKDAVYVVMPDHILITTHNNAQPAAKLNAKIRGVYEKRPLNVVLREIAESVGVSVVFDNRCGEKAKTEVSATFVNDAELGGALRTLAEMADLKVVLLDATILVTTPAHAETLRKEYRKTVADNIEINKMNEKSRPEGQRPNPTNSPNLLDPLIDPLWPYIPSRNASGKGVGAPA